MPLNQSLKKNSNVLWTISIIQDLTPDAQTKSEFTEMANDVLNTPAIDSVTLCLADNLQRFRLMIEHGITEEKAIEQCQKMSDAWHQDNSESIQQLKENKKLTFLTWQEFLDWPDRQNTLNALDKWYKEDRDFRMAVDGRVRQAQENMNPSAKVSDVIKQTELLKKYLIEECAFQKFAASKGFKYELYKTQQCKAMKRTKSNSDFVPQGFMVEISFSQFNTTSRKSPQTEIHLQTQTNKSSFEPIFSKNTNNHKSIPNKAAEFIQTTMQMLPIKEQEKAIESLIKFTTQEILPLCYTNNNIVKI